MPRKSPARTSGGADRSESFFTRLERQLAEEWAAGSTDNDPIKREARKAKRDKEKSSK